MITAIKDMGNPFECESSSLTRLHTRDVLDDVSVDSIQHIKETGQKQYKDFIQERLVNRTKPVTDTLSRNNVSIFQKKSTKSKPKEHETVFLLKNESSLFARLYVSCQKRDGDLNYFFQS